MLKTLLLLSLFSIALWGTLPQAKIEQLVHKYHSVLEDALFVVSHKGVDYYVIHSVEERLFSDETLEEEKKFLKADIKQILFTHMKKEYPQMVSLDVSELLHHSFWESKGYYHHLAQVKKAFVKPVFEIKDVNTTETSSLNESSMHDVIQEKIDYLEEKQKMFPKNMELLKELSSLYKKIGDVDGYANANERIMDLKMAI